MKTTEEKYKEIEEKHLERIKSLRKRLVRGDWQEVIKICNAQGCIVTDTPHAINIIKSMSAKKHMTVYNALEHVINERMKQFEQ